MSDFIDNRESTLRLNRPLMDDYDPELSAKVKNGIFVGTRNQDVLSFKGIPYAMPLTMKNRFRRAQEVLPDEGVYEARFYGKSCIQTKLFSERASYHIQGEDCLTLNIWTHVDRQEKKPVMVFIHGGSYGWGGTADPLYDGDHFVSAHPDVVLVTINYRIGLLGFIDLSSFPDGQGFEDSRNLGLYDQILALKWINENIAAFGGNCEQVTIFGESAGGGSVALLAVCPEAKPYFKRLIAESGSVALTYSLEEAQTLTEKLKREHHIESVAQLLSLTEEELKVLNEPLNEFNNFPIRDGRLFPNDLYAAYESGMASDKDMMIGTMQDEVRYWIHEIGGIHRYRLLLPVMYENNIQRLSREDRAYVDRFMESLKMHKTWQMTEFYNEVMFRVPAITTAASHAAHGGRTYVYYWTYPSSIAHSGACHAVELAYVFHNLDQTIYTGDHPDRALALDVQTMWVNFAKTGHPDTPMIRWPQYDGKHRYTMILGKDIHVEADPHGQQRMLIEPLNKYHFNGCYAHLDYNVPSVRRYGRVILYVLFFMIFVVIAVIKAMDDQKGKM